MLRRLIWPALAAMLLTALATWAVWAAPITRPGAMTVATLPNDPLFPQQWAYQGAFGIQATDAWSVTSGGDRVITIAVLDSGFDQNHPDLAGRWGQAYNFLEDGWPAADNWTDNYGTAVAGVVAATGNNAQGVTGTAWRPTLMPLRVVNRDSGTGAPVRTFNTANFIAQALDYATERGARIAVFGFSLRNLSEADQTTIRQAIRRNQDTAAGRNLVVIAPVGENPSAIPYPAALDDDGVSVIGVTGVMTDGLALQIRSTGQLIVPSGSFVDLAAPGENILTTSRGANTTPQSGYEALAVGTEGPAGFVAGVAALALSVNPSMTPDQTLQVMRATARDLGAPGRDDVYGAGLVNAAQAVLGTRHFLNVVPNAVSLPPTAGATTTVTNPYTLASTWTLVSAPPWLDVSTPVNGDGFSVVELRLRQAPNCLDGGGGIVVFRSSMPLSFNTEEVSVQVQGVGPCRRLYLPHLAQACDSLSACGVIP